MLSCISFSIIYYLYLYHILSPVYNEICLDIFQNQRILWHFTQIPKQITQIAILEHITSSPTVKLNRIVKKSGNGHPKNCSNKNHQEISDQILTEINAEIYRNRYFFLERSNKKFNSWTKLKALKFGKSPEKLRRKILAFKNTQFMPRPDYEIHALNLSISHFTTGYCKLCFVCMIITYICMSLRAIANLMWINLKHANKYWVMPRVDDMPDKCRTSSHINCCQLHSHILYTCDSCCYFGYYLYFIALHFT